MRSLLRAVWRKPERPAASSPAWESAALSDRGRVREENEDRVAVIDGNGALLAVVADGMGGHASGEVASRIAAERIASRRTLRAHDRAKGLAQAFRDANAAILRAAERDDASAGMGTTCTALLLDGGAAVCAHVGDSRLYLVRDGAIYRMTEDDSLVMEMARRGVISREEARRHDERNLLVRALGTHEPAEFAVWPEPLAVREGDRFVLCSDGLHDLVPDDEIREVVLDLGARSACERLVAFARERGGYDNISVVVVLGRARS